MMLNQLLDNRIARALTGDGVTAAEVGVLIEETRAASLAQDKLVEELRERSHDPALSTAEANKARLEFGDANFAAERLAAALVRLKRRADELAATEEDTRKRIAFDRARAERDALAAEIARVYPEIVDKLVDLLRRLSASDAQIEAVNAARPRGEAPLLVAELTARGLDGFGRAIGPDVPRLTRMRLPAFEISDGLYAWPLPEPARPIEFFLPTHSREKGNAAAS